MSKSESKVLSGDTDPKLVAPDDAKDLADLWLDPGLGDGIVEANFHTIPIGRPKNFFRTVPDEAYRRRTEIYTHKPEGAIDEQNFIIAKPMRGRIEEARPCTLVTVVYRDGSPRLWPIKFPRDGEHDNDAWVTARAAARAGLERWVKLVWVAAGLPDARSYAGIRARPGLQQAPAVRRSRHPRIRCDGIIRDTSHPIYRELFGIATALADDDAGDL